MSSAESTPLLDSGSSSVGAQKMAAPQDSDNDYPALYAIHKMSATTLAEMPESQRALVVDTKTIATKRYATSVDDRNFLTVYEYSVNNQWIIWDYYTGYVHLTGLWKAVGNNKADIVKLLDNSPQLEPVIRRVRGGFLKIQGTWLPFDVAKTLAQRICYHIRFALVPLFGEDFPASCLEPGQPGFGQLQLTYSAAPSRKRRRAVSASGAVGSTTTTTTGSSSISAKRRRSVAVSPRSEPPNLYPQRLGRPRQASMTSSPRQKGRNSTSLESVPKLVRGVRNRRGRYSDRYSEDDGDEDNEDGEESDYDDEVALESVASSESYYTDDEDPLYSSSIRQIPPPPMPVRLVLPSDSRVLNYPDEFVALLQATRSLQQLSAGRAGRSWSYDNSSLGGGFECGGKIWNWDGGNNLNVIGPVPRKLTPIAPKQRLAMDINGLLT